MFQGFFQPHPGGRRLAQGRSRGGNITAIFQSAFDAPKHTAKFQENVRGDSLRRHAGQPAEIRRARGGYGSDGNGARRYTYNTAGLLIRAEAHDGTTYQLQAEMVYNGMGQRLQMTAWAEGLSLTTDYTLDMASGASDLLSANTSGNATFYLYARGRPVGETTNAWS